MFPARALLARRICFISCFCFLPLQLAAEDVVRLKDGLTFRGELVETGGSELKLLVGGGGKVLRRGDIAEVDLDQARSATQVAESDGVVREDGHFIRGKVEEFAGSQVRVTLPNGASVRLPRNKVKIIRKGETIEAGTSVYTKELGAEIRSSLTLIADLSVSAKVASGQEAFLKRCGIFAIDLVRDRLRELAGETGRTRERLVLAQVERLYRLKEVVSTAIEQYDPQVYEIFSSGDAEPKKDLLFFVFYRFSDDAVPLARLLATDRYETDVFRSYAIDFLRRMQKNRELVEIFGESRGPVQLASAIALGKNRVYFGVPTLIEALSVEELAIRKLAVEHLREFSGESFRFRADGAPGARERAVERWWKWWKANEQILRKQSVSVVSGHQVDGPERREARRLWHRASLAHSGGDSAYAEKLLREAVESDPSFVRAQIFLTMILLNETKEPVAALEVLRRIEAQRRPDLDDEDRYWVHLYTGHAKRLLGNVAGARDAYEQSLLYDRGDLLGLLGLAESTFTLATSNQRVTAAERREELMRSLKAYRDLVRRIDAAHGELELLTVRQLPTTHDPLFDRRQHNRWVVNVRDNFRENVVRYRFAIARIESLLGRRESAIRRLEKLVHDLRERPEQRVDREVEVDVRNLLGLLYEGEGEQLKARRQYRTVLRLDPDNDQGLAALERLGRQRRTRRQAND